MVKGVFVRFGFDELESRKFIDKSRAKQQRTPHEVYDVQPSLTSITLVVVVRVFLYTYTGVGLSALVYSKTTILICYLLDYQQVHENTNVSIILLGDKKEPTK